MSEFMGTHTNRLDAKGRVSIPAVFRAALRSDQAAGVMPIVVRPSHIHQCVDGWTLAEFRTMAAPLDAMDVFSPERDELAAALYCDAYTLEADREGRIVLPELLVSHAGLTDTVVFMGMGRSFQIWEPRGAEQWRRDSRERARDKRLTLKGSGAGSFTPDSQQLAGTPGA